MKQFFLLLMAFSFLNVHICAAEADSAKDIFIRSRSISTETTTRISSNCFLHVFRWVEPSDGTISQRFETQKDGKITDVLVINGNGAYDLYPSRKIALKSPFYDGPNFDQIANYSKKECTYNGQDCFEITQKIDLNPETFEIYLAAMKKRGENDRNALMETFYKTYPYLNIYYISKSSGMQIGNKSFTPDGKLNTAMVYENVKRLDEYDEEKYIVPNDYKVTIPKNMSEYLDIDTEILLSEKKKHINRQPKTANWSTAMGGGKQFVSFLLHNGRGIALGLAVGAVFLALVIKVRKVKSKRQ